VKAKRSIIILVLFFSGLVGLFVKSRDKLRVTEEHTNNSPINLLCFFSGVIEDGESLYLSFKRIGVPDRIWAKLIEAMRGKVDFRRIHPGEEYKLAVSKDGSIVSFEHRCSPWECLRIYRDSLGVMHTVRDTVPFTRIIRSYSGVIRTTLWDAMVSDSIPLGLIDNLIRVFAYDIDFATETRSGDEFSVLYEEERFNGKIARVGDILAAEYRGKFGTYHAYKFEIPNTKSYYYYDDKGRSLKRSLLRTPVAFKRISSRFSYSRLHPILGIRRPHLGVDYAAPTGTPVIAAGDGVIEFAGWNGGFGNFISINHGHGLITTYGHLAGFARGIKKGMRVREGQVIGYVGATGLATGPHLDYRIQRGGKFVDPLKLTSIPGPPLPAQYLSRFQAQKRAYLNLMGALAYKNGSSNNQSDNSP